MTTTIDLMKAVYQRTQSMLYGGAIHPRVEYTDDVDKFLASLETWLGALAKRLDVVADEKRANDNELSELIHQRDAIRDFLGLTLTPPQLRNI